MIRSVLVLFGLIIIVSGDFISQIYVKTDLESNDITTKTSSNHVKIKSPVTDLTDFTVGTVNLKTAAAEIQRKIASPGVTNPNNYKWITDDNAITLVQIEKLGKSPTDVCDDLDGESVSFDSLAKIATFVQKLKATIRSLGIERVNHIILEGQLSAYKLLTFSDGTTLTDAEFSEAEFKQYQTGYYPYLNMATESITIGNFIVNDHTYIACVVPMPHTYSNPELWKNLKNRLNNLSKTLSDFANLVTTDFNNILTKLNTHVPNDEVYEELKHDSDTLNSIISAMKAFDSFRVTTESNGETVLEAEILIDGIETLFDSLKQSHGSLDLYIRTLITNKLSDDDITAAIHDEPPNFKLTSITYSSATQYLYATYKSTSESKSTKSFEITPIPFQHNNLFYIIKSENVYIHDEELSFCVPSTKSQLNDLNDRSTSVFKRQNVKNTCCMKLAQNFIDPVITHCKTKATNNSHTNLIQLKKADYNYLITTTKPIQLKIQCNGNPNKILFDNTVQSNTLVQTQCSISIPSKTITGTTNLPDSSRVMLMKNLTDAYPISFGTTAKLYLFLLSKSGNNSIIATINDNLTKYFDFVNELNWTEWLTLSALTTISLLVSCLIGKCCKCCKRRPSSQKDKYKTRYEISLVPLRLKRHRVITQAADDRNLRFEELRVKE